MEPQLLPYLWFVWGWWWCPGWTACYFPLHTPPYSVSSQEIWVLILRGKSTGCFYFVAPEQQHSFFLHEPIVFLWAGSSRTLWLKVFPCKPFFITSGAHYLHKELWLAILLIGFPDTCFLTFLKMSVWLVSDFVSTPFTLKQQLGIPPLPLLAIHCTHLQM